MPRATCAATSALTGAGPARTAGRRARRLLAPFGCCTTARVPPARCSARMPIACPAPLTAQLSLERRRSDAEMLTDRKAARAIGPGVLGYPLVHANSSRRRRAAAGGGRAIGEQVVHRPRGAGAHAQGARPSSSAPDPPQHLQGAGQRLVRRAAGRVLRDRRAQRQRQEHAAEVPGRASTRPRATSGCRGRLSTFIELGVGFNPDLAARDNVVMNGIMLGLSPREARKRYDSVIEFAELQEFKDLKLKNYSSGMHVRLAFSVAIQVDADILHDRRGAGGRRRRLPAEVLRRVQRPARPRPTIIFVTHDMGAMQRFCHRALLLERGDAGAPRRPARGRRPLPGAQLRSRSRGRGSRRRRAHAATARRACVEVWVEDDRRRARSPSVPQHQRVTLKARVAFMVDVEDPAASVVGLQRRAPRRSSSPPRRSRTSAAATSAPARRSCSRSRFDNVLAPGRYAPVFQLAHRGSGLDVIDRFEGSFSFVVTGPGAAGRAGRPAGAVGDQPRAAPTSERTRA